MRVSCLILVVAGLMAGAAHAEKVRTNQTTKLYARAGEQATVLLKVDSGQNMTLLEQEGRWLKVRVQGRTGYVPRSKVDMADDEDITRNTRRRPFVDGRSKKRGAGQEEGPEDRIGADAIGEGQEDEPKAKKAHAEDDEPKAKKAKKDDDEPKAKKSARSEDDDEPKAKKAKKDDDEPKAKKTARADDEDEPKAKKAKKDEDEPKAKAKKDDDEPKAKAKKGKGDEDDEPKMTDDEEVDDSKTPEPEEDTRQKAHVTKKVSVYDMPKTSSEEIFVVRPADVLYPVEQKGDWTYVENAEGDSGWVQNDFLQEEARAGRGGPRKRAIDLGVRMGLMFIQQGMRSAGSNVNTVPDNYNITTSSLTMSLGGGLMMPYKKQYLLGAALTYDYAKTFFGGVFYDPDGATGSAPGVYTKLTIHNINFRGQFGYELRNKRDMVVFGRLGYRYQSFMVDGYSDMAANPAKLPQEIVKAPTLGAALAINHLTDKIGMTLSLDAIVFGAGVAQTKGLEDGGAPSAKGAVVGASFVYKWKKTFDLQATYDLRYMKIDFGAPVSTSTRGHMGTDVVRTDVFHALSFGILRPF